MYDAQSHELSGQKNKTKRAEESFLVLFFQLVTLYYNADFLKRK